MSDTTMLNKKRVLGRGLSALLGDAGSATQGAAAVVGDKGAGGRYFLCPIAEIIPNTLQPRKTFDEAAIKELADSIRENGVIEPLIVRRGVAGGFELIAGERRLRASRLAGLAEVPAVAIEVTDEKSLEFAIIENIQREDLNAVEEAEAYRSLMNFGLTQEDVARKVGKERATVANYLRLLKLPLEVKEELVKGAISMGHARAILSLEGHAAQSELCRRIVNRGLSVREAERLANSEGKTAGKKGAKDASASSSPELAALESELRAALGSKVKVNDRDGKGNIEIFYYSADERERIIDLLRKTVS